MNTIDNFFSPKDFEELDEAIDIDSLAQKYFTGEFTYLEKNNVPTQFKKMIDQANVEYNVVEFWVHDSQYHENKNGLDLERHKDKDEILYINEGIERYPQKTLVYYPYVSEDFSGGELVVYYRDTEQVIGTITPKKNRLVYFDSENEHEVKSFTGRRISLVLNPWIEPPFSWNFQ